MKIKISDLKSLSVRALKKIGFSENDCRIITEHLVTAELCGKKSHGIVRIPRLKKHVEAGKINTTSDAPEIKKETPISLHVDGKSKTGLVVLEWVLDKAIIKAKKNMVCFVGTRNVGPVSGMIGYYARKVTKEDLILLGFNNSPAGLTPFGSKDSLWGTNPLTVGIPTSNPDLPVVLDMASSKMTFGDVMINAALGKPLPKGVSVDSEGNPTTDPKKAADGSQLPFEGRKGSGLAMIVEILAGPLVGSKGGNTVKGKGEWGSFFVVINPELYRPIEELKGDVDKMIQELKSSKKQEGVDEIFYPGERSGRTMVDNLKSGEVEVVDELIKSL
ncbi:MAG TPA: Ldh family oxidoreductase [Patescibacteria group bacterium]|nr:Ldh family oxidoreductase [Patescibacteria group bacterium]